MNIIDPHIHLFDLTLGDYQWLKPENPPLWQDKSSIYKNFSENDLQLKDLNKTLDITGFVHIEAGFDNQSPWREVQWLESSCKLNFKSVACVDLTAPKEHFLKEIENLLNFKSVVGCRHILDESAVEILQHPNSLMNLKTLSDNQLSFDLQMPLSDTQSVETLTRILKQLPELIVIINHAGSPPYTLDAHNNSDDEFNLWLQGLKAFSQFKNCAIKCSGWEMKKRDYHSTWCEAVIDYCINLFTIDRVMLGSNFPLCLFSQNYHDVWQFNSQLAHYNQQQLEQLCSENTKRWYKFQP
ncbi:MAG: amidohydrolase family protein [Nonlabens ulvanivorans]|uniref:amidohydrolase family protein n=1 Tax=Nonlabens ulvanivorans TaxID=906888 RepID=UPI003266F48B